MKDEGFRAPGLLCFTPTLPLIPPPRMHNSYVVTDHPQPASPESQSTKRGGGNDLSNTDADAAGFIYLVANMTELFARAHALHHNSAWLRLPARCGGMLRGLKWF